MADWQYKDSGAAGHGFTVPTGQGQNTGLGPAVSMPGRRTVNGRKGNAYFQHQSGKELHLWLTDITAGFQIGGSFAQSARIRDFFPRNFMQPAFTLVGTATNQEEYGNIAEFARSTQLTSLHDNTTAQLIKLFIDPGTNPPGQPERHYRGYQLEGYITSVDRRHERFIYAPQYTIQFVVSTGDFGAKRDMVRALAPWSEIFQKGAQFQQNPDEDTARPTPKAKTSDRFGVTNNPLVNLDDPLSNLQ